MYAAHRRALYELVVGVQHDAAARRGRQRRQVLAQLCCAGAGLTEVQAVEARRQ